MPSSANTMDAKNTTASAVKSILNKEAFPYSSTFFNNDVLMFYNLPCYIGLHIFNMNKIKYITTTPTLSPPCATCASACIQHGESKMIWSQRQNFFGYCEEILTKNQIETEGKEIERGKQCFSSSCSLQIKKPGAEQHSAEAETGAIKDSENENWKKTAGLEKSCGLAQHDREGTAREGGWESVKWLPDHM